MVIELFKRIYINDEPTIYAVSTKGRVLNMKRNKMLKPHIQEHRENKALETLEPNNVYINYALYHKGKYYYMLAHRLVAEYFIPVPQKYLDMGFTMKDLHVDHKDNVRYHNTADNLQWLTPKENVDKVTECDRQRYASGTKHGMCKLEDWQLEQVGRLLEENILTQYEIALVSGVPHNTVMEIRAGRRFKYLQDKYNFENYNRLSRNQYTEEKKKEVLLLLESGKYNFKEISETTGVSYSVIKDVAHGRTWTDLSQNYDLSKFLKKERKNMRERNNLSVRHIEGFYLL